MLGISFSELGYTKSELKRLHTFNSTLVAGLEDSGLRVLAGLEDAQLKSAAAAHASLLMHLTHNKRHETRKLDRFLPDLLSELWGYFRKAVKHVESLLLFTGNGKIGS